MVIDAGTALNIMLLFSIKFPAESSARIFIITDIGVVGVPDKMPVTESRVRSG